MSIARNTLYGFAGNVVPLAASIVTIPLYLQTIGAARYGALSVAWLLLAYFGQADFGIGRAITQRIAATAQTDRRQLAAVVWSGLAMIAAISVVISVVTYFAARWYFAGPFDVDPVLRRELLESAAILSLCISVVAVSGVLGGVLAGLERFGLLSAGQFVSTLSLQVLPLIVALVLGPNLTNLVIASLASRLLLVVVLWFGVWRLALRRQPVRLVGSEMRHLGTFGSWVMVTAFVGPLMVFSDRFVIGSLYGAVAVAAYVIPSLITFRVQLIPTTLAQALFPRFAAEAEGDARERCRDYTILVGLLFSPIVLGLICLAGPLLELWLGSELDPRSILIGQILMVGCWFNAYVLISFAFVQGRGDPRFGAIIQLIEAPLYFALLFGLGAAFGLAGIAAAYSVRCLLDAAIYIWRADIAGRALWWGLAPPTLLVAIAVALGPYLQGWGESLIAASVLCLAATAVLIWQLPDEPRRRMAEWPIARHVPGLRLRPDVEA